MSKSQHYFLVAAEVAFLEPQNQNIGALKLNVLMRTRNRNFAARDIGKAQQVAQLQFFEKLQDKTLEVKDVYIFGISYLGLMTEEVFQAAPKGTELKERARDRIKTPFD